MPLPKAIRRLTPDPIRNSPNLRGLALGAGLIPPRTMHAPAEAELLSRLARGAQRVVEIGVYEGSSAIVLADAVGPGGELHLIDPYPRESGAHLVSGWRGSALASQIVVWRHVRGNGPKVRWHIAQSQEIGRHWNGPEVDFVFIDGDHFAEAVREDWDVWHPHVRRGGYVAFHDALGGSAGPTAVVDELFHAGHVAGWHITDEVGTVVAVQRS
jgi:predicted O-methyltransferase YrrM